MCSLIGFEFYSKSRVTSTVQEKGSNQFKIPNIKKAQRLRAEEDNNIILLRFTKIEPF